MSYDATWATAPVKNFYCASQNVLVDEISDKLSISNSCFEIMGYACSPVSIKSKVGWRETTILIVC